ncbi:MAG: hypothetical protein VCD00_12830 [Candidatus Hydrogenedentota bacterium]
MSEPTQETPKRVRICRHARSNKSFYADGVVSSPDAYDCGIIWCAQTSDGMGPDGAISDVEECIEGRECYE